MASPTPKPRAKAPGPALRSTPARAVGSTPTSDPVDPIWIAKAFGIVVLASLVCGYLSLCLLFYQGQWQMILHPTRSTPPPSTIGGAPIQTIHFGVDESATPQLTGWWVPAEPLAHYSGYTVLYLPGGDGSLADSDALVALATIHTLGLNLFAFDYRGYGQSAAAHPNQQHMSQDAFSAWQYLTVSRALPPAKLVLFGNGVGCFMASQLAGQHHDVSALVLDSPRPDLLEVVLADPRVQSLPVRTLFHERFDLAQTISSVTAPKLLLFYDEPEHPRGVVPHGPTPLQLASVAAQAPFPKVVAYLTPSDRADGVFASQLSRFLDEYLR